MGRYSDIIKKKKKEWDCEDLMEGYKKASGNKIPFSSPLMNYCTYGGVPRGKVSEFFGEPGGGKSTTCVDICKNAYQLFQQEYEVKCEELRTKVASGNKAASVELDELMDLGPKKVLYIDLEHAFDEEWSKKLGIEEDKIDIMTPPDVFAEDILNMVLDMVQSGEVGLIVMDSIPSLVPKTEFEKKIGERTVAALAGLLTVFFRKIVPLLTRYDTTLININQVRDNQDNPYVVNTPGGRAAKFYSSLRIQFRIGAPLDFLGNELAMNAENPAGNLIHAKIVKQKTAPWDRKMGSYYLMFDSGIRNDIDIAQLATKKYGIIKKSGAWFTVCDPSTGEILEGDDGKPVKLNGMAKVLDYLQEHPTYYANVSEYILADIEGRDPNFIDSVRDDNSLDESDFDEEDSIEEDELDESTDESL